jgi:hypothetical protein
VAHIICRESEGVQGGAAPVLIEIKDDRRGRACVAPQHPIEDAFALALIMLLIIREKTGAQRFGMHRLTDHQRHTARQHDFRLFNNWLARAAAPLLVC